MNKYLKMAFLKGNNKKFYSVFLLIIFLLNIFFTNGISASTMFNKINLLTKNHQGVHKIKDGVNNYYYWRNNNDIGNPDSGGYGNMRTYYKNGYNWRFKFGNKTVADTIQFHTIDDDIKGLKKGQILFCIEPLKIAEWITDIEASHNHYQSLPQDIKRNINNIVSYSTSLYSLSGNMDYLASGQLLVWKAVGAKEISFDKSIQKEYDEINSKIKNHALIPSFSSKKDELEITHTLKYNHNNKRYELILKDDNNVLDERYLNNFIGIFNNIHIEDAKDKNSLYIWINANQKFRKTTINSFYNPLPSSGEKFGIKYSNIPIFANSGQDLVSGLSNPININFNLDLKVAQGNVIFTKKSEKLKNLNESYLSNPLKGAKFGLFDTNGKLLNSMVSDQNGLVKFNNLNLGKYYIQEIEAPLGYLLDSQKYFFEINQDSQTVKIGKDGIIYNSIITGKVEIKKIGEINVNDNCMNDNTCKKYNPLSNAEFSIFNDENHDNIIDDVNNPIQILITNKDGYAISDALPFGSYILKETKAPSGYELNNQLFPFNIENNNEIVKVNNGSDIVNKALKKQIIIEKTDQNNNKIPNVKFELYQDFKNKPDFLIETLVTDKNGIAKSKPLIYGDYYLKEIYNPIEYVDSNQIIKFSINEQNFNEKLYFKVKNELITNDIEIYKLDDKNNDVFLEGAEFSIFKDINANSKLDDNEKADNNIVISNKTDSNGFILFNNLPYGHYIVKETKAPSGYQFNDNLEYPININIHKKILKFNITNKKIEEIKFLNTGKELNNFNLIKLLILFLFIILLFIFIIYLLYKKLSLFKKSFDINSFL